MRVAGAFEVAASACYDGVYCVAVSASDCHGYCCGTGATRDLGDIRGTSGDSTDECMSVTVYYATGEWDGVKCEASSSACTVDGYVGDPSITSTNR